MKKDELNMKKTWVQDAKIAEVLSIIMGITVKNAEYIHSTRSKYITGPAKGGQINDVGIYFLDPTVI